VLDLPLDRDESRHRGERVEANTDQDLEYTLGAISQTNAFTTVDVSGLAEEPLMKGARAFGTCVALLRR
jgi:hypothetical protein